MTDQQDPTLIAGMRIRRRRQALHLRLSDVASQAGITEGHLSQIERGKSNASVATLQRICAVLRLEVGSIFAPSESDQSSSVLRHADAQGIHYGEGASKIRLNPRGFDHLELLLGSFDPGGSTGPEMYTHGDSEEILLVVEGEVDVFIQEEKHHLAALDSVHYRSSQPHRVVESTGIQPARVVWGMSPPTY
ncbi:cupin domain-containing protein [Pseudoclavibacter sp. CFCC 11306]|uniref:cupin domain-containing protein n=1 Tax=Pseudoclavibacter sp. CFCC 11306 TaxID=1564493 RepID=UPI00130160E7|nr:cupin domain-containing protein [Pseudoclavibacter sp. CFCC 11306]KAB1659199.1 cupin domain-containing protein [Pseudoclavibacter sp. CFCC 11306]